MVADVCEIQYEDIPHFPKSTAPGHKSRLLLGTLNKVPVVVMQGRFHLYEGYNIHQVDFLNYLCTPFEKSNFCPKIQFDKIDNFSREIKVVNS